MTTSDNESSAGGTPAPAAAEGAAAFAIALGEARIEVALEGALAAAFRSSGEDPHSLLVQALARLPDGAKVAANLRGRSLRGGLRPEAGLGEGDGPDGRFGIDPALFETPDRIVRRILLQTSLIHALRLVAFGKPRDEESETALLKKDAGLFLLLLTDHKRQVFFLPRLLKEVEAVAPPASGFREILVPILERLPFVEAEDPADSPYGRVFLNARVFDRLAAGERVRVVLGGVLAWYNALTLGFFRPFFGLFRSLTPYFEPARRMLAHSFQEGFLVKKGFMGRAVRSLVRGKPLQAVEMFWSGWNPVLVRVAVRPMFRLLGGNRRPLLATVGTFFYTAWVVHLLWAVAVALLAFRLAHAARPDFRLGLTIGSDTNFIVLFSAVGAYVFFGFLSGLSKVLRARRGRAA